MAGRYQTWPCRRHRDVDTVHFPCALPDYAPQYTPMSRLSFLVLSVWCVLVGGSVSTARTGAAPRCVSVGEPSNGWLVGGVALPGSERLLVREGRNFGTPEMVQAIVAAVDVVHARYPGGHRLVTGDLSRREGGKLSPHLSHQSGRDADIGYYMHSHVPRRWFRKASSDSLDVPRTWAFVASLLADDKVEYIFMDYRLQKLLYAYARDTARLPAKTLSRTFAYPRGRGARVGIVRHLKGHRDHMHVRFRSPVSVANQRRYAKEHGADSLKPTARRATVRRGWTLSHIARKYRTSVPKLRTWNKLRRGATIYPGDRLIVGWRNPLDDL
jgi:murein endopeptidase